MKVYGRPDPDSAVIGYKHRDDLLEVGCQVVGKGIDVRNHLWNETPEGYVWDCQAQPVRYLPNPILDTIPEKGIWTDITVPYIDGLVSPRTGAKVRYRLYYGMVLNVDRRQEGEDGEVWYRVHDENGIRMHAPGWAFRRIEPEELAPISPDVEDKVIKVNLWRQDLSAFERGVEVYYCRIASGYAYREDGKLKWHTPVGTSSTWRKMVSRHMSGGDLASGYDQPGVGWTILFSKTGAAIHATYWHNDYGRPKSHGCVNLLPEDSKWLFRWTTPVVEYYPGDVSAVWPDRGTSVVVEAR